MKTTYIENRTANIISTAVEILLSNKRRSKNIYSNGREITLVNNGDYSHSIKIILGEGWFNEEREKVTE